MLIYLSIFCYLTMGGQEGAGGPKRWVLDGWVLDPPLSMWEWLGWYSEASLWLNELTGMLLSITPIIPTWRWGDLRPSRRHTSAFLSGHGVKSCMLLVLSVTLGTPLLTGLLNLDDISLAALGKTFSSLGYIWLSFASQRYAHYILNPLIDVDLL